MHVNLGHFFSVWNCCFFNEEILTGDEELAALGTNLFATRVDISDHEFPVQHMVDILKTTAEFHEASERIRYIFSLEQFY